MFEGLRKLERRQLQLLGGGLLLLMSVLLTSYLVIPQIKSYRAGLASLSLLQASVTSGANLDAQLTAISSNVQSLERELHGDLGELPAKQMEAYIIGRLQRISWRNNVEFISVEPQDGDDVEQFREIMFEVELRGDYLDLYRWLRDAGEEMGFVVVKRLEMMLAESSGTGAPNLLVKLTMASYRNSNS